VDSLLESGYRPLSVAVAVMLDEIEEPDKFGSPSTEEEVAA
jgi:hypothetical protein